MIVICERCDTRFQLDDARVPETGARVRCSRCKHAFVVLPEGASGERTVHALAAAAAETGEPTPPGVTDDLPAPLIRVPTKPADDENEWKFAESDPPVPPASGPRAPERAEDLWETVLEEEKPPEARELDALGNPESWSFVSEEAPPLRSARAAAPVEAASAWRSPGAPVAVGPIARVRVPTAAAVENLPDVAAPGTNGLVDRIGWALTGLLLLALVHGIGWSGPVSPGLVHHIPLHDGLVIEDLTLRRLENLVSGPVLVVSGSVTNPGAVPAGGPARLRARLVSGQEAAEAEALPPRTGEALRESSPETVGQALPALLPGSLAPGTRIPFEAVISQPPAGDAELELQLEPDAASQAPAYEGEGAPARSEASPPRPLPSSG